MKQLAWEKVITSEFDYNIIMDVLSSYQQPRRKLNDLLAKGEIIRVKKGLYVFSDQQPTKAPSRLRLGNLIYGPSYVSLETALGYYGLIPEWSFEVTSVTSKRNKYFETPLGRFSYTYLNLAQYGIGYTLLEDTRGFTFLIATPEKALMDKLWHVRTQLQAEELETYLFEDLRIDALAFKKLRTSKILELTTFWQHPLFAQLLLLCKGKRREGKKNDQ